MIEDNVKNIESHIFGIVRGFFEKHRSEGAEEMSNSFEVAYNTQLEQYELKDDSEVEGLRRLIVSIRPALTSVLDPGEELGPRSNASSLESGASSGVSSGIRPNRE